MTSPSSAGGAGAPGNRLPALVVGAIGVVYGDIGTSPLYTMREAFGLGGLPLDDATVLGVLSLVFWALLVVVTLKYIALIMRADNQGQGGVLALATLAVRGLRAGGRRQRLAIVLAMVGAALFYGDGVITPAISVLSAVEGLQVATPAFTPYVVPIAIAILVGLFLLQRWGTGSVGKLFGPVPQVPSSERVQVEHLGGNFHRVLLRYGFLEHPNVTAALMRCQLGAPEPTYMDTSFFLSRESLIPSDRPELQPWRERIFMQMVNSALDATRYFRLPVDRVVEIGSQVEI